MRIVDYEDESALAEPTAEMDLLWRVRSKNSYKSFGVFPTVGLVRFGQTCSHCWPSGHRKQEQAKETPMSGPNDTKEEHGGHEQQHQHQEQSDGGKSGHGAASALAHMISQGREHRHQTGEADDAAGVQGQ